MNFSENNSLVKNEINTERDHPEPNLFNNSLTFDQIRDKAGNGKSNTNQKDNLLKNLEDSNLKTTETDMYWDMLANKDKLVNESEVRAFEKKRDSEKDDSKHHSDSLDDYMKEKKDDKYDSKYDSKYDDKYDSKYDDKYDDKYDSKYDSKYDDDYDKDKDSDKKKEEYESEEDKMLKKLDMLRQLGELTQHGVKLSQNYNMNSDYKAMKYEYELHRSIRDKRNGIQWLSTLMINICYGIELGNEKFNPFDFKLKGWADQIADDADNYYDVFGELYEKYFKAGKPVPPELKLMFMISGSAIKFHLIQSKLSSIPNLAEMMNRNPHIADELRAKAMADKIRKQSEKQRTNMNNATNIQHNEASQKATDIQMLREKQQEYIRMQQEMQQQQMMEQRMQTKILEREEELHNLQNQLNMQMSESRSTYSPRAPQQPPLQRPPIILPQQMQQPLPSHMQPQMQLQQPIMGQQTMAPPRIPPSLRNNYQQLQQQQQEFIRQQQIMQHKKMMQNQEFNNMLSGSNATIDTISHDGSSIANINPKIEDILSKISRNDTDSEGSRTSTGRRRRRRRKNAIKIDT